MKLILVHDEDACPIVSKQSESHLKCWRLQEEDGFDIPDELAKLMTGEEVYRFLSDGEYEDDDHIYTVDVIIDDSLERPAIYVYHEDGDVRRLLRENNIFVNTLEPGTFLRVDELWELVLTDEKNIVYWNALSTVTRKKWSKFDKSYTLNPTQDLEEASEEFLEVITDIIPSHQIKEFSALQNMIDNLLTARGFGDSSPLCKLLVSHEGREFTVKVVQVGGKNEIPLFTNVFTISPEEPDESVLNGLISEIDSGGLSQYNIENTNEFLERVSYLLDQLDDDTTTHDYQNVEKVADETEEDFESELLSVIEEYREELKQGKDVTFYLAQSLKQLVIFKIEQEQLDAALDRINECMELIEPKSDNSSKAQKLFIEIQELKAQIGTP